jgi:hypothetical protein
MDNGNSAEDRLLSVPERALVAKSKLPRVAMLDRNELQVLGRLLRAARDRARGMAYRQKREMLGKAPPRGAAASRENAGTEGKAQVLAEALKRVDQALRRLAVVTQANRLRAVLAAKRATDAPHHPDAGWTDARGMHAKPSQRPTVRSDPREVGRVSQAFKVAQAKRDNRPRH